MARLLAPPQVTAAETLSGDAAPQSPETVTPPESPPPTRLAAAGRRVGAVPRRVLVAAIVLVLLIAAGSFSYARRDPGPRPLTQQDVTASIKKAQQDQARAAAAAPADATLAYASIQPSLVLITTDRSTATVSETSTGAGVIVNADGTILTALHVVARARSIKVAYTDGTSTTAQIKAQQPENDIATLAPATLPQTLVPAVLGGQLQVGATVFAVGHPLGLTDSLSAGVVSALDRSITNADGRTLQHLIQIDAAVNPGNSGGPLLNRAGQVVGIVTALANPSNQAFFVGIGFAVPIATAGGAAGAPPQ
ncbi:trypsin-like peptidase domain-containing protein [Lapillicoccus sp.]|uniref:S1C family serine protease n=1 Tax=Lapillicoccus sp. TaxID=1909287 RepID=UPI0025F64984|nr:trypsin-like peptidase domain-containing protein [Lapillicoccus sp.]